MSPASGTTPARKRATLSGPTIGRRAAETMPPPSLSSTTSGASRSIIAWRSPPDHRLDEGRRDLLGLGAHGHPRPTGLDVLARPVGQLAHGGRRAVRWRPPPRRTRSRRRRAARTPRAPAGVRVSSTTSIAIDTASLELDVLGDVRGGEQRLGQPRADVRLPAALQRAEPVERLPGDDADEVRAGVAHLAVVDVGPAQPRVLDDVVGVRGAAEQLVGDGEEQRAEVVEHLRRRVLLVRHVRRSSQRSLKPWLVRPRALLKRDRSFSTATIMVSSTNAALPICARRASAISSVTSGGVTVIASAYSMTCRSSGVKTSDSRQRGTSSRRLTSRPLLCRAK